MLINIDGLTEQKKIIQHVIIIILIYISNALSLLNR